MDWLGRLSKSISKQAEQFAGKNHFKVESSPFRTHPDRVETGVPLTELEAIQAVSDQYRKDGYTIAAPPDTDLAPFLEIDDVDLIATKGDEIVAIQMKRQDDQGIKPVIMASGRTDHDFSLSLLEEAEKLLMPETRRAALLMAWMAFEAAAREVLQRDEDHIEKRTPVSLIQEIFRKNYVDANGVERLRQAMYNRNLIVHGVEPTEVATEVVAFLLDTVRSLKNTQLDEQIERHGVPTTPVRIQNALTGDDNILYRIMLVSTLLDEVLGTSRTQVLADWDQGEDSQGKPVIILKLSDLTGTVTASFTQEDLMKTRHMKTRFLKLWGNLLRFRAEEQLENLTGAKGGA